ncbi:uncharacterized protein E0L32_007991 [Thyridium curvatum]|uniref:Zn(2)-C6 fungal-type domain-containing protein n=1 Tax=Thyridium curvatum TaxID=1093900 RepID=A0A507B3F9_9PEZI|nr:uncharacterized protein E0L32_007991 [Thyridium curvatum]TPX11130.1 hypothetical protein E0L32_007991 [Thyridium curvatum]
MSEVQAAVAPKRKGPNRRIPDRLRKRSAQSCDLCRKRRCKCVPDPSGHGCMACRGQGLDCAFTLPRKTRFYGSVDDLSDRYKCLEAIVRGAFPGDPISTAAELRQLGQRMGYLMPDPPAQSAEPADIDEILQTSSTAAISGSHSLGSETLKPDNQDAGVLDADTRFVKTDDESSGDEPLSLIRDTSGREHYIGPSGSLQFFSQLRRLVISREKQQSLDEQSPPTVSKFTEDDTAQALEADTNHDDAADPTSEQSLDNTSPSHGLSPGSITSSIAKEFTKQPYDVADEVFKQLPPRHIVDLLLQSFFKHVHGDFPLFHRGTFEEEYESYLGSLRQKNSRQQAIAPAQVEWGWIGCLQMMIVFGSLSQPDIAGIDHVALRRQCVTNSRNLLPQLISKCTLSNVRALLLLSLFLHNNNERNAAWNLVGTATRISFALGLHRQDVAASFRPIEREVRKRVFCTLYWFEQFLASSLGRPSGLNDCDVEVASPREGVLSGYDEGDELNSLSLKLQVILGKARISQAVRHSNDTQRTSTRQEESAWETLASLKSWKAEAKSCQILNIPCISEPGDPLAEKDEDSISFQQLKTLLGWQNKSRLRAALLLHMQYRYIAVMVTRPFLLRDVALSRRLEKNTTSSRAGQAKDPSLAELSVQNACQLTRIVLLLDSFGIVNGISGMDVFYTYCASMVLILRSLRDPTTDTSEQTLQAEMRQLISASREVVLRVVKSGTMKRFARVMASFEDSVFHHSHSAGLGADNGQSNGQMRRATAGNNRIHSSQPATPNVQARMPLDPRLQGAAALPPGSFDDHQRMGEMWPQTSLVTFEGLPDFNSWMVPFFGGVEVDTPMMEWGEFDALLAGQGTQQ